LIFDHIFVLYWFDLVFGSTFSPVSKIIVFKAKPNEFYSGTLAKKCQLTGYFTVYREFNVLIFHLV